MRCRAPSSRWWPAVGRMSWLAVELEDLADWRTLCHHLSATTSRRPRTRRRRHRGDGQGCCRGTPSLGEGVHALKGAFALQRAPDWRPSGAEHRGRLAGPGGCAAGAASSRSTARTSGRSNTRRRWTRLTPRARRGSAHRPTTRRTQPQRCSPSGWATTAAVQRLEGEGAVWAPEAGSSSSRRPPQNPSAETRRTRPR